MLKKFKILMCMLGLGALCAGAAACASDSLIDRVGSDGTDVLIEELHKDGYNVVVINDSNGGRFVGRDGVTIIDAYDPDDGDTYTPDAQGKVSIKLVDPLDPSRESGNTEDISLTNQGYTLYGWYQNRELLMQDGKYVDGYGNILEESDGSYYYLDEEGERVSSSPAYTYSDRWDFEEDRLVFDPEEDEDIVITLYACWVPNFEFDYYYADGDEWVLYGTTTFDWVTANAEDSTTYDRDTIWMPDWSEGAMNYKFSYNDKRTYEFPDREGYTFAAAYADEDRTWPIEGSLEHAGTVDIATGTAQNRVQNIYVDFDEGTRYRIESAEQLSRHGDADGYYEILGDLDFKADTKEPVTWPAALSNGTFTGRFAAAEGRTVTIKNLAVSGTVGDKYGGMFGVIGSQAVITGVNIQNVTYSLNYVTGRAATDSRYGLFAGEIEDGADISVNISQATLRIGAISPGNGWQINLIANGSREGISYEPVGLVFFGRKLSTYISYTVQFTYDADENPVSPDVKVGEDGSVTFTVVSNVRVEQQQEFVINYMEDKE